MEEKREEGQEHASTEGAAQGAEKSASSQAKPQEEKKEGDIKKARFSSLTSEKKEGKPLNLDFLMDISLDLSIELGRAILSVKDILSLRDGSVVELNKLAGDPVDVFVNNKLIARGEVVVIDDNFGVRVTEILSPAELIKNLKNSDIKNK